MSATDIISSSDTYDSYDYGGTASDVAAASGETAASIGQTLIEGAQLVGGVLTVAGALTGNRRLMQTGAVLGLGATAISALSSFGDAATTGGMKEYGSAPTQELQNYAADASSANEAAGLANTSPEAMNQLFAPEPGLSQGAAGQSGWPDSVSSADNGYLTQDAQSSAAPITTQAAAPPEYSLSPGSIGGGQGVALQSSSLGQSTGALTSASDRLNSTPTGQQGIIGRTMGWLNDRENAGIVKLGTGLIGGALQGYQQERALDEQRRARDEQRQYVEDQRTRYNQSIINQPRHR